MDLPEGFPVDPKQFKAYMDLFAEAYETLVDDKAVTCAFTKKETPIVVAPDAVIMDVGCSGFTLPIFTFIDTTHAPLVLLYPSTRICSHN